MFVIIIFKVETVTTKIVDIPKSELSFRCLGFVMGSKTKTFHD